MKAVNILIALVLMVALLSCPAFGQGHVGSKDHLSREATTTEYDGLIAGKYKIKLYLTERDILRTENGETFAVGTHYTGYYFYVKQGKRIGIRGDFNAQGPGGALEFPVITLEETVNGKVSGYFEGHFSDADVYSGNWYSTDGKHKYRFILSPKRAKRSVSRRRTDQRNRSKQ